MKLLQRALAERAAPDSEHEMLVRRAPGSSPLHIVNSPQLLSEAILQAKHDVANLETSWSMDRSMNLPDDTQDEFLKMLRVVGPTKDSSLSFGEQIEDLTRRLGATLPPGLTHTQHEGGYRSAPQTRPPSGGSPGRAVLAPASPHIRSQLPRRSRSIVSLGNVPEFQLGRPGPRDLPMNRQHQVQMRPREPRAASSPRVPSELGGDLGPAPEPSGAVTRRPSPPACGT